MMSLDLLAAIEQLATLPPLEYDRVRKVEAKKLGIRRSSLDAEVEKTRASYASAGMQSARGAEALTPPPPIPSREAVAPAALLDELRNFIRRFVVVSEDALTAITLWVVFTYFFEVAETSPRLAILSPTKRCGKSRLLELLLMLCPRAITASNLTPATVFRTIEISGCTLLIDEADTFARDNPELRGLLNSGHTRANAYAIRNTKNEQQDWYPRRFSTWAPIAIAAIGGLPETWRDRSIVIRMKRKLRAATVERLTRANIKAREQAAELTSKLARFAQDNLEAVRTANPDPVAIDNDRAIDNWEHLLAIADIAGSEWARRARAAALGIEGGASEGDESLNVRLLSDINTIIIGLDNPDRVGSTELCEQLNNLELGPWAGIAKGKGLTPARMARMLRVFDIAPRDLDGRNGYVTAQLREAFAPYAIDQSSEGRKPQRRVDESGPAEVRNVGGSRASGNADSSTQRGEFRTSEVLDREEGETSEDDGVVL